MSGPWQYGWEVLALTLGAWRTWASNRLVWPALPLVMGTCVRRLSRAATPPSRG